MLSTLPPLSTHLIEELDRLIPARCIGASESASDAHRYAGKRELVEALIRLKGESDSNILNSAR